MALLFDRGGGGLSCGKPRNEIFLKALFVLVLSLMFVGNASADFDPVSGLRVTNLSAPVPSGVDGAITVEVNEVEALWKAGAIMIDVAPASEPTQATRGGIPGSNWLVNVGFGELSADQARYLEQAVVALTTGNQWTPIVVYCDSNCWHGWNAVKRLTKLGYKSLFWFPEGVPEWKAAGLPWQPVRPVAPL